MGLLVRRRNHQKEEKKQEKMEGITERARYLRECRI